MAGVIGIDLGTTNTVAAAVREGRAFALADEAGEVLIPSVVSFHPNGSVQIGRAARERRLIDPVNTIYSVKRLIGRSYDAREVQKAKQRFPFELAEGPSHSTVARARSETYTLPEISAFVLDRAKHVAEAALGEKVEKAVITVPANFNDLQRAATKLAGNIAGLEVLRIINEPTAAALAYGFGKSAAEKIAVYDFGGGTFDITLLELSGEVFEVLATAGNTFLGGDDIDVAIAESMGASFFEEYSVDPISTPVGFERLRWAAEQVKQQLSSQKEARIAVPEVMRSSTGAPLSLAFSMTRDEFERLLSPIINRTFEVCNEALKIAGLAPRDLDHILLVGGSTRIPLVQHEVEAMFRRPVFSHINPHEAVAMGAAIQADALSRVRRRRSQVPPPPQVQAQTRSEPHQAAAKHGIESLAPPLGNSNKSSSPAPDPGFALARESASKLNAARIQSSPPLADFTPLPLRGHSLPPALPATLSVAPSSASATKTPLPLLVDVTPLTLSVETVDGYCDVIINRNTPVPCEYTRSFVTASDHQTTVRVRVSQGESHRFVDNTLLGEVVLSDVRAAPRGEVQIAVSFSLDNSGILSVSASDLETGRAAAADLHLVAVPPEQELSRLAARHLTALRADRHMP